MATVLPSERATRSPVVQTTHGALQGITDEGVHLFLGIPYAAPPFGEGRLRPPHPAEDWDGVRDATRPGPEPPQVAPPSTGGPDAGAAEDWGDVAGAFAAVERAAGSVECLNLNVWTPDPGATGLPVMVWIQGGMFELSSTAAYDGSRFARDGVVCVVINWRPGAEGFLYLGDGIANLGLLDQIAALEWVRDNIAGFGGDPANVTVFGESAGAMSIGTLLAMPAARGLFHRAILQSGAAQHVTPPGDAARIAAHLADLLEVGRDRDAIAGAGVDPVAGRAGTAQGRAPRRPRPDTLGRLGGHHHHAVATRRGRRRPAWRTPGRIAAGSATGVDVLVGTNVDDWRLWLVVSGAIGQITDEILTGPVPARTATSPWPRTACTPPPRWPPTGDKYPTAGPGELLAKIQTDWWMRIPAIRLADALVAADGDPQRHLHVRVRPASPGLGAVHALEVPFVFDTIQPGRATVRPPAPPRPAPEPGPRHAHRLGELRQATATPAGCSTTCSPGPRCGSTPPRHVVDNPRPWERALWHGIR